MTGTTDAGRQTALIFAESAQTAAELLTAAREQNARAVVLTVGPDGRRNAEDALARGADEVLLVLGTAQEPPAAEALAAAIAAGVEETGAGLVLIGATRTGTEVAARLAQRLEVPCASDCLSFRSEGDALIVERRVYGGRFVATQALEGSPRVLTLPPRRFAQAPESAAAPGVAVRELALELPPSRARTRAVAPRARSEVDVTKAEVIVAAGRGVRRVEDLALLEQLAKALGGVLAGSRPLTGDLDWLPTDRRIGLSGQTVRPNLYIACGISGQIEHVVGIKGARTVVAINNDAKAPIHAEADYSIIGDLYEIVPALIGQCGQARGDG
ncbi:MAG: electron transfer flavoprotein subunit alpha/FixB family protein [Geminicoccaceae bacterium]